METEAAVTEAESEAVETEAETEAVTEAEVTEAETEAETESAVTEAESEAAETEAETEPVETEESTEAAETEGVSEGAEPAADIAYTFAYAPEPTVGTLDEITIPEGSIVVLYNNDAHGGISNHEDYSGSSESLGYAGLAAIKEDASAQAAQLVTVDLGDAIQGSVVTTESNGKDAMDLMAAVGYDICIPGNHEFDYGMEEFLTYAENSEAEFLSCNFVDTETGDPIFKGYDVVPYEVDGQEFKIGYVAMSTPETIAKSTPTFFQDEEGNYIYGFDADTPEQLYGVIQDAIDGALSEGADMIVALGHMGDVGVESDWSSLSVIANTEGIDVFLDGHAHSEIPGEMVADKNGEEVLLSSTGTKLENIGVLTITPDESGEVAVSTNLVDELTQEELSSDAYAEIAEMVDKIEEQYEYLFVKVGFTDYDLVINDPADPETRLVRTVETNMGDFLTDAYRIQSGADIGFLNGGSIRADISAGDIVYMDLITVMPWNSETGVIEVTGQQILDCLEMGAHLYPEECGGFIQTSGLTYSIDTTIPSSVNVNSDGEFVSVDGEYRVKDVMVGEEPLDLEKTYTLAINKYYSEEAGDGMTMFKGSKVISPAEGEEWTIDHDVVIDYLAALGDNIGADYENPYGQGRITLITEETEEGKEVTPTVADEAETEAEAAETESAQTEAAETESVETEAVSEAVSEAAETEAAETESAETEAPAEAETEGSSEQVGAQA